MSTDHEVTDWATDFDLGDERYMSAPYGIWDDLRQRCPVAHTDRRGGAFMPTRYDDIVAVAYDVDHFSSREVGVRPTPEGSQPLVSPPITSDPPFHGEARRLLLPHFSPQAVAKMEPITQSITRELLDALDGRSQADAAVEYSQRIPVRVIAHLLGVPASDEDLFTGWALRILQDVGDDPDTARRDATKEVLAYFVDQVAQRRMEPTNDLVSELLAARMGDAPLTEKHLLGSCFLLLLAGVDTTWSAIGSSLEHLGRHAHDRDRLVADPSLVPVAVEELLRAYAPVTMARVASQDTEVAGCPVKAGERVLLNFPAANRDPAHFDRPEEVIIDREHNRHLAFGVGVHRCLGSNLARMEMRVALTNWLARFPNYTLDPDRPLEWGGEQSRGPRSIPVLLH